MSLVPYFFELSGEHPTLPFADAFSSCTAECDGFTATAFGPGYGIFGIEGDKLVGIATRLALTHRLGRHLGSCPVEEVKALAKAIDLPSGSIAVRAKRFQGQHPDLDLGRLAAEVGGLLAKDRKVNLSHPDVDVRILISDMAHLYICEAKVDRSAFEKRKVAERPFFSPISLHPRYARALVNMTLVKRGERLLDPFCGTGGVLIEAASIGVRACGSDISPEMVQGCLQNLEHFGLPYESVEVADIGDIEGTFGKVDAVATDPPYGRATSTHREPLGELYDRALASLASVLDQGSRAGMVLPRPCPQRLQGLDLVHCHQQKVHRSLDRHYCIFRRR